MIAAFIAVDAGGVAYIIHSSAEPDASWDAEVELPARPAVDSE